MRIVVNDRLQGAADVGEQLADLILPVRQSPLGEEHLRVVSEEIEDAASCRCDAAVVEGLQILDGYRFSLFVGHGLRGQRHGYLLLMDSFARARRQQPTSPSG